MPILKNVEKRIYELEGFSVVIKHLDGRDVRGDRQDIPRYTYTKAAKNGWTVSEWKEKRFQPSYPGFDVDVLDGVGENVTGQKMLGTVRDTYNEDD